MSSSAINLVLAAFAGLALGLFYFGGLWYTVRRLSAARRPWLLVLGSYVVRLVVTVVGMYLVMAGDWKRLVACLAGFLLARIVLTRHLGPAAGAPRRLDTLRK